MPYTTSNISGNLRVSGGLFEVIGTGIVPNLYAGRDVVLPAAVETRGLGGIYNVSLRYANQDSLEYALRNQKISLYSGSTSSGPWLPFVSLSSQNLHNATGFSSIASGAIFPGKIPGTNWFPKVLIEPLTVDQKIQKTSSSGLFALQTNERVGIGLTNPIDKLHVRGNLRVEGSVLLNGVGSITGELISGKVLRGGDNSTIRGGNTYGATILAGANHLNTGTYGIIVGGFNNQVLADSSAIVGGYSHENWGKASFIGGGGNNRIITGSGISSDNATIVGGSVNVARGNFATIVGGYGNSAFSDASTSAGGINNYLSGNFATIGGGGYNKISGGCYNTVGGGECNLIVGNQSVIPGGHCNCASGFFVTAGGGGFNNVNGWFGVIAGGYHNDVGGPQVGLEDNEWFAKYGYASVLGGANNKALANSAVVLGGWCNCVESYGGFIGGGKYNCSMGYVGYFNAIVEGKNNSIVTTYPNPPGYNSGWSTGYNGPSTHHNTILNGVNNQILNAECVSIINGNNHQISSGAENVTILGGENNWIWPTNKDILTFGRYILQNRSGLNGNVLFGNNIFNHSSGATILTDFTDTPRDFRNDLSLSLFYHNGVVMEPCISIDGGSFNRLAGYVPDTNKLISITGEKTYIEQLLESLLFRSKGAPKVGLDKKTFRGLTDAYGNQITGIYYESYLYDDTPINLGNNSVEMLISHPLYPASQFNRRVFNYSGELVPIALDGSIAKPLSGVMGLSLNPTIAIGTQNRPTYNDIAIGVDNQHYFEKNGQGPNRKLSYISGGPEMYKSSNTIMVGQANRVSGKYNLSIGTSNFAGKSWIYSNNIGYNNRVWPEADFLYRKSFIVSQIGNSNYSWDANPDWSGSPASNSNLIGFNNFGEADINLNIVGSQNSLAGASNSNAFGNNIDFSGEKTAIFGSNIFGNGKCASIFGSDIMSYCGLRSITIGRNNIISPMISGSSKETTMIGVRNYSELEKGIIIGNENYIASQTASNIVVGQANQIDKSGSDQIFVGLENYSAKSCNVIGLGRHNFITSAKAGLILGSQNTLANSCKSLIIGDKHGTTSNYTVNIGQCAWSYNLGQISTSTYNGFYNRNDNPGQYQDIELSWHGVTNTNAQKQLYLDGVESSSLWTSGLAYIPSGRIWNGTLNIVAARTGLTEFKTWQKAITVYNKGSTTSEGVVIAGQDDIKVYGSPTWGIMLSGNKTNNGLAIYVTGENNKNIVWSIRGKFSDSRIPTTDLLMTTKIVSGQYIPVILQQ